MLSFSKSDSLYLGAFTAMASPCEVLVDCDDEALALSICEAVMQEALRIEQKFSRYRDDNIVFRINNGKGKAVEVDDELARLLNFADQCYQLSHGQFDITSGVLRNIWRFDGSNRIPTRKQAKALLPKLGWKKVSWQAPTLILPEGMEIDLGGIGKEYAVDNAAQIASKIADVPVLINFGGDLFALKPPRNKKHWQVGVEAIGGSEKNALVQLEQGALATSGDARRFLEKDGVRYSHVLNPVTGWPVSHAPHSVTVAARTCIEAGFLSTLAMLKGKEAESFLQAQEVLFWIQR